MTKLIISQIQRLVEKILNHWKSQNVIILKVDEKTVLATMVNAMMNELKKEEQIEIDVKALMDQMERQHEGEFQRHKMFPMLKQKLAKERKVIL